MKDLKLKLLMIVGAGAVLVSEGNGMIGPVDMSGVDPHARVVLTTIGFEDTTSPAYRIRQEKEDKERAELNAQDEVIQEFRKELYEAPNVKGREDIDRFVNIIAELIKGGDYILDTSVELGQVKIYNDHGKNKIEVIYPDIKRLPDILRSFLKQHIQNIKK